MPVGRRQASHHTPWADSGDLVCVATADDVSRVRAWRMALDDAQVDTMVQTITVSDRGQTPRMVYLLYVPQRHEKRALAVVDMEDHVPIFPLAHLRRVSRPLAPVLPSGGPS